MINLLNEEIERTNVVSYKWKYNEYDSQFSYLFDSNLVADSRIKWNILTEYWITFYERGIRYKEKVIELAELGNVYAISAVVNKYLRNSGWKKDRGLIEKHIDKTIERGIGYLSLDYALALDDNEKKRKYYLNKAAENGCIDAQNILLAMDDNINSKEKEHSPNKLRTSVFSFESELVNPGYLLSDLGSEYAESVNIPNMLNISVRDVERCLEAECKLQGIPALVLTSSLTAGGLMNTFMAKVAYDDASRGGGLLNKTVFRAVKISHPNPPQQYCDELIVFLNDGARFFFVGASKAFKEMNEYSTALNGDFDQIGLISKMKFFSGGKPDEDEYNAEILWHQAIYNAFLSII